MPSLTNLFTDSFIRPNDATAYASGDLVANSTVAGTVVAMQFGLSRSPGRQRITRGRLRKTAATIALAAFRAHLFSANPCAVAPTNGDNGAFLAAAAASYLGALDFATVSLAGGGANLFSDGARLDGVPVTGSGIIVPTGGDTGIVWALLEARAAYVPTALEQFFLTLESESLT
jgi:hypothetical protein